MSKKKFYLGKIMERNGDMEYTDSYIFTTTGNPGRYSDKVAMNWRSGSKADYDEDFGGYWSDNTLIFNEGYRQIPEEHFNILSIYMAQL